LCDVKSLCQQQKQGYKVKTGDNNNEIVDEQDVTEEIGRPRSCTMKNARISNAENGGCRNEIKRGACQSVYSKEENKCYSFSNRRALQSRVRGGDRYDRNYNYRNFMTYRRRYSYY
jgi:hypothetical protein